MAENPVWCNCSVESLKEDARYYNLETLLKLMECNKEWSSNPRMITRLVSRFAAPESWEHWAAQGLVFFGQVGWKVDFLPEFLEVAKYVHNLRPGPRFAPQVGASYTRVVPVQVHTLNLADDFTRPRSVGIPLGTVPRTLTFSTLMDHSTFDQSSHVRATSYSLDKDEPRGQPPYLNPQVRVALQELQEQRPNAVREGNHVTCQSLTLAAGSQAKEDSCTLQCDMANLQRYQGVKGTLMIIVWDSTDVANALFNVKSTNALLIELWSWPAVRCLAAHALDPVCKPITAEQILSDFEWGDANIPTETQLFEDLGGKLLHCSKDGANEATRRAEMHKFIFLKALTFQAMHREAFIQVCPVYINRRVVTKVMNLPNKNELAFHNWSGSPRPEGRELFKVLPGSAPKSGLVQEGTYHNTVCVYIRVAYLRDEQENAARQRYPTWGLRLLHGQWQYLRYEVKKRWVPDEQKPEALEKVRMVDKHQCPFHFTSEEDANQLVWAFPPGPLDMGGTGERGADRALASHPLTNRPGSSGRRVEKKAVGPFLNETIDPA